MNQQYQQPQGFSFLPPVVKNLVIINAICFLGATVLERAMGIDFSGILGLHFFKAEDFHFYQLITYMFMHGNLSHIFFNMFALWMFGYTLENHWGSKRFLLYYFVTGIGAGIVQEIVWYIQLHDIIASGYEMVSYGVGTTSVPVAEFLNHFITIGASGAVYGILLAFGMMYPNSYIYIYFLFPIKAKWFVLLYGLLELGAGLLSSDNVAHFAHLGGMIFGIFLILYWRRQEKKKQYRNDHWQY